MNRYDKISKRSNRVARWKASLRLMTGLPEYIGGEVVRMNVYEVLTLLFLGGTFLIALLAYIDRDNKRK